MNIDYKKYSKAFQDFYHHYFENLYLVGRREISILSFYYKMSKTEKALAKQYLRQEIDPNIEENEQNNKGVSHYCIEALGFVKDEEALPLLNDLFDRVKNDAVKQVLLKSIWQINGDDRYFEFLKRLIWDGKHKDYPYSFVYQLLVFKDQNSILLLLDLLKHFDEQIINDALRLLNNIEHNQHLYDTSKKIKHNKQYYLSKQSDKKFIEELVVKMKNKA